MTFDEADAPLSTPTEEGSNFLMDYFVQMLELFTIDYDISFLMEIVGNIYLYSLRKDLSWRSKSDSSDERVGS